MEKYTLRLPNESSRGMFTVTIVADSNDADYITTINSYSKENFENYYLDDLIDLVKNYSERHQLSDCPLQDIGIPSNGWDGNCHSLKKVVITYVDSNGLTWDLDLNTKEG
ncbi:hypothetical protein D3C72_893060 [compost metagenome]